MGERHDRVVPGPALRVAGGERPPGATRLAELESRELRIHGHRIHYRTAGSGPPLVLVHGMLESSAAWRRVAPELAERHTVIVPDLLGHGESDAPGPVDYSVAGHAVLVRDLLDALGHGSATLVGHSMGGGVVLAFAQLWPERVDNLALVASGGFGSEINRMLCALSLPGAGLLLRALTARPLIGLLGAAARAAALLRLKGPSQVLGEIASILGDLHDGAKRRAFLTTLRGVVGPRGQRVTALDRLELLKRFRLLLVWGDRDHVIPLAQAEVAHAAHPESELVLVHGAGHLPHLTRPAEVARGISEFLARDPAAAASAPGAPAAATAAPRPA